MKKTTKIILISSLCFMGTGALLTGAGMAAGGWPGFVITHDGIHSYSTRPISSVRETPPLRPGPLSGFMSRNRWPSLTSISITIMEI